MSFGSFGSFSSGDIWNDYLREIPDEILAELASGLSEQNPTSLNNAPEFWEDLGPLVTNLTSWSPSSSQEKGTSNLFGTISESRTSIFGSQSNDEASNINDPNIYFAGVSMDMIAPGQDTTTSDIYIKDEKLEENFEENDSNALDADVIDAPPPPESTPSDAKPAIDQILLAANNQEQQLEQISQKLRKMTSIVGAQEELPQLQQTLFAMSKAIPNYLKELQEIYRNFLLTATELYRWNLSQQTLQLQQQRLELFRKDVQKLVHSDDEDLNTKCNAAFVIVDKPFPQVMFKGRKLDHGFTVKLLLGAKVELAAASKVKAAIADEEAWRGVKNPLEYQSIDLDKNYQAKLNSVVIHVSTRMSPIQLKFTCTVKDKAGNEATLTSDNTAPIIVITNESQWHVAADKLLLGDCFRDDKEDTVSWPHYANTLHRHVLCATTENFTEKAERPLQPWEFQFIHKFLGDKNVVKRNQAQSFWNWFGHVLTTIRFKRHIRTMWSQGFVYGLISKKDCNKLLAIQQPGSFIIRFSDSVPGSFAIAYTSEDEQDKVKHFLVRPEEIGANKSLADFLREKSQFKYVVQIQIPSGKLVRMRKEVAFKEFFSKKKLPEEKVKGYQNTD